MSMAVSTENKTLFTPEDLMAMPDGKNYELVDGREGRRLPERVSVWSGSIPSLARRRFTAAMAR